MSATPPPDWAALYQKHRDAMYRVAARTLRASGRSSEVDDAVMAAIESLMKAPPTDVRNWEALLVQTTRLRALDMLGSADVRHASGKEVEDVPDRTAGFDVEVVEAVDRTRAAAVAREKLAILDERHRMVAWEYLAKGRPRPDVAAELGVSPARISQIAGEVIKQLKRALEEEGVEP